MLLTQYKVIVMYCTFTNLTETGERKPEELSNEIIVADFLRGNEGPKCNQSVLHKYINGGIISPFRSVKLIMDGGSE